MEGGGGAVVARCRNGRRAGALPTSQQSAPSPCELHSQRLRQESNRLAQRGHASGVRSDLDPFGEGSVGIGLFTNPCTTRSRRLATGSGNQRRDGAETGGRHIVVNAFVGAGGNVVGLVPDADIPA